MELLLDTAHTDTWRRLAPQGAFDGIMTNPLLMQRAGIPRSIENYARLHEASGNADSVFQTMH